MYAVDPKLLSRLAPRIRRVLIVDSQPAGARVLSELMRALGSTDIMIEEDDRPALDLARTFNPEIVFVEATGPRIDGPDFTRRLRRSHFACRKVPVIVVAAEATAAAIKASRDSGVHEFLRKPFNAADLLKRVEAVALKPREWVEAVAYVGPDRRRFNSGAYDGPMKRESDRPKDKAEERARRLDQAFRILKSALQQFDTDPPQAIRAMREQARLLGDLSVELGMPRLAQGASLLDAALRHPDASRATLKPAVGAVVELFEPNAPSQAA